MNLPGGEGRSRMRCGEPWTGGAVVFRACDGHSCRLLAGHLGNHECACSFTWRYVETPTPKAGRRSQFSAPFNQERGEAIRLFVTEADLDLYERIERNTRHRAGEARRVLRAIGNHPDDEWRTV